MFRFTSNGKTRTVSSLNELDLLLKRGIINERTPVLHEPSGMQKSVADWLFSDQDGINPDCDRDTDYEAEVERMLNLLLSRPAGSFSDEELAGMKRFIRNMVKNDMDKEVDENLLFRFRKQLRRTTAEQLIAKQDVKVSVQDILRPDMSAEDVEAYRAAMRRRAGSQSPQPAYTNKDYQGHMRYRSLPSDSVPGEAGPPPPQETPGDQSQRSWFHHPIVILAALIVLPPLGLLLLWTSPRDGFLGNFMLRMIITGIVLSGLSQEEWYAYEFRNVYQTLAPFPVMSVGQGFNQPYWLPDILLDTFEVGDEITYTAQKLKCAEPVLRDEVVLEAFGKQETLLARETEWEPDAHRYMGRVRAEYAGVYHLRLVCGERVLVETKATVIAP